jgi:methylmalonyl-CoA mutase cobalamin-binding subunit
VAGEQHELGAMQAAVVAADEGWRVLFLGPDLPATNIARVARARAANAVAVSIVYASDDARLIEEVRAIRDALPENVALVVGGRAVTGSVAEAAAATGATVAPDLAYLRRTLRVLKDAAPPAVTL